MAHAHIPMPADRDVGTSPGWLAGLAAFCRGVMEGFEAWRRFKTLEAASDQELCTLGIEREDIARYAVLGDDARRS